MTVLAVDAWKSNAHLIADVAALGYLRDDWLTLDSTYGRGAFWTLYRPHRLVSGDMSKGQPDVRFDYRHLPFADCTFDAVVYDPPFKLNGTSSKTSDVDERYGVEEADTRENRLASILSGAEDNIRVTKHKGMFLVKCQNQVNGGKVRWQTDMLTALAYDLGCEKVDEFHALNYRPQPEGRSQQHARRNYSTLMVFRKTSAMKRV